MFTLKSLILSFWKVLERVLFEAFSSISFRGLVSHRIARYLNYSASCFINSKLSRKLSSDVPAAEKVGSKSSSSAPISLVP